MNELEMLRREFQSLVAHLSPYIGQEEMQARYNVIGQTLLAMERRKEIPMRVKGRWLRAEVIEWEASQIPHKSPASPTSPTSPQPR